MTISASACGKNGKRATKMNGLVKSLIALCTILGFAFGAYLHLDARHTPRKEFNTLEERVAGGEYRFQLKVLEDARRYALMQLWDIQKRYGPSCGSLSLQCEQLKAEIRKLEQDIQALKRRGR